MWPILLLSIAGWALAAERLWRIARLPKDADVRNFAKRVYALMDESQWLRAEAECLKFAHPLARLFKAGFAAREASREEIKDHLEKIANHEVNELEKNFGGILTVVGVSPMVGFLGTITGLIQSFMSWERLAENITVGALAAGIYQAMITTAAGLIVAIPLYVIYQFLVARVGRTAHLMSDEGDEFLLRLSPEAQRTGRR